MKQLKVLAATKIHALEYKELAQLIWKLSIGISYRIESVDYKKFSITVNYGDTIRLDTKKLKDFLSKALKLKPEFKYAKNNFSITYWGFRPDEDSDELFNLLNIEFNNKVIKDLKYYV
jgi:hypothetical protein